MIDGIFTSFRQSSIGSRPSCLAVMAAVSAVTVLPSFLGLMPVSRARTAQSAEPATYVSPSGSDEASGTWSSPLRTIKAAVSLAQPGATVFVRRGTYREAIGTIDKKLVLRAYGDERVVVKGSTVVDGWVPEGSLWVKNGWTQRFCQSCYPPGALAATHPNAARPDMVFMDGSPLQQVATISQVGAQRFFADYARRRLYIGSDPTGRVVEATVHEEAVRFTAAAAGSTVRGLSFMHYSPTFDYSRPAMVVGDAAGLSFEDNTFAWSAARGLSIFGASARIVGNTFAHNGIAGLHGHQTHGTVIRANHIMFNNNEHFASGRAVSAGGGAKLTKSRNVTVENNVFDGNDGNGFWCDLSCHKTTIVSNLARMNSVSGVTFEVSSDAIIASNMIVENRTGLKISGSNRVQVYNNTLIDNGRHIGVYEDPRRNVERQESAMGITWDTAEVSIHNTIMSSSGPRPTRGEAPGMVDTLDNNDPDEISASEMVTAMDHNAYYRRSSVSPATAVSWARKGATPVRYLSYRSFRSGTGHEQNGLGVDNEVTHPYFADEPGGNYTVRPESTAHRSGRPLPPEIARALGVPAGEAVDRGALRWPGRPGTRPPQRCEASGSRQRWSRFWARPGRGPAAATAPAGCTR